MDILKFIFYGMKQQKVNTVNKKWEASEFCKSQEF